MAKKIQIVGKIPSVDPSELERVIGDYLKENPPVSQITINGQGPDQNGNFVIKTQDDAVVF